MATVNFLYRSTRPEAFLDARLLFRDNNNKYKEGYKDFIIGAKTQFKVSKEDWQSKYQRKRFGSSVEEIETQKEVSQFKDNLNKLSSHILDAFINTSIDKVNKDWLVSVVNRFFNPEEDTTVPTDLTNLIDFYINQRKFELSETRIKRLNVIKNKLKRFEKYLGYEIKVKDVNESFKSKFIEFSEANSYAQNTQKSDISVIKTVCTYGQKKGLQTSLELADLVIKEKEAKNIYLSFEELKKIKELDLNIDYLDNARDWLIVSCFTGQRISDFMRFDSSMNIVEEGRHFIEFKQKKTGKAMRIPLLKEVREVLDKRSGEYPRKISHQKYNDYIKEVCRLAGIDQLVEGSILECIAEDKENARRHHYRRKNDVVEKWRLVSSHIGRRSLATNFYNKIATTHLINMTGHSTERQFLSYIKKSNKDLAIDSYDQFENIDY